MEGQAETVDGRLDRGIAMRFLRWSGGFWSGPTRRIAFLLTLGLAFSLVMRLVVDLGVNRWNRWFFDALERHDARSATIAVGAFLCLVGLIAAVGVCTVRFRETLQVRWREWCTARLLDGWLRRDRFAQAGSGKGIANPEYRISDDVRMATEPLTDFAIGLFTALLSAVAFLGILWSVGGSLRVGTGPDAFEIPAFMVLGAAAYALVVSCLIPIVGRRLAGVAAARNESEARFRAELIRLRENADGVALSGGQDRARAGLAATYRALVGHWLALVRQHGHVTWVMIANSALIPVVPLLLAAPKYLSGELSLGQVMQLASAFVQVQAAIGWLVDNYWRVAEWFASARRVVELVDGLDEDSDAPLLTPAGVSLDGALHVEQLSLVGATGRFLLHLDTMRLAPGERILVSGAAGAGRDALLRSLAGLWPWGAGRISVPPGARIHYLPPVPVIAPGPLSATLHYPETGPAVPEAALAAVLVRCGLGRLVSSAMDQDWQSDLSPGERQRLGLARLLLRRPDIVIIDEATGGLDDTVVGLLVDILERDLPHATVVIGAERAALERLATRRITLRQDHDVVLPSTDAPRPTRPVPLFSPARHADLTA